MKNTPLLIGGQTQGEYIASLIQDDVKTDHDLLRHDIRIREVKLLHDMEKIQLQKTKTWLDIVSTFSTMNDKHRQAFGRIMVGFLPELDEQTKELLLLGKKVDGLLEKKV